MTHPKSFTPTSLKEAIDLMGDADLGALPLAGCTDWMVHGLQDGGRPRAVVDLLRIPELRGIAVEEGAISIGAATSFYALRQDATIQRHLPTLAAISATIGAWQIQNKATIGGNIANASPAGDSLPVLLSLGAELVLAGPRGERALPYAEFHEAYRKTALRPGELVVRVRVPIPPEGATMAVKKVGTREAQAISKVIVALYGEADGAALKSVRIAAGSVAPIPLRLKKTEALVEGQPLSDEVAQAASVQARAEVRPIEDVRSTAPYRHYVLGQVIWRMLVKAGGLG